jgi:hypothetical protein
MRDPWRNVIALELYERLAQNVNAETRAYEIRMRAARKAGELLKAMEKAKGFAGNPGGRGAPIVRSENSTAHPKTLAELGISKQESSDWQKLAAVPQDEFETALAKCVRVDECEIRVQAKFAPLHTRPLTASATMSAAKAQR